MASALGSDNEGVSDDVQLASTSDYSNQDTSLNGNEEEHEGNLKRNKKTQVSRKPRVKRQKTSMVWNHFIEDDAAGKIVSIYDKRNTFEPTTGTSSLKYHMDIAQKDEWKNKPLFQAAVDRMYRNGKAKDLLLDRNDELNAAVRDYITWDGVPPSYAG